MLITEYLPAYSKEARQYKELTNDECIALWRRGDTTELFQSFAKLGFKIAAQYHKRACPIQDLIQEANKLICEAISSYEERFTNFKQFVAYKVRNGLIEYVIEKEHIIPMSIKTTMKLAKMKRMMNRAALLDTHIQMEVREEIFWNKYHQHGTAYINDNPFDIEQDEYTEMPDDIASRIVHDAIAKLEPHEQRFIKKYMEYVGRKVNVLEICEHTDITIKEYNHFQQRVIKKMKKLINKNELFKSC